MVDVRDHQWFICRTVLGSTRNRQQLTFEHQGRDRALERMLPHRQFVTMYEAQSPASISMCGCRAWNVHHAETIGNGIQIYRIWIVLANPGFTNRQSVETMRCDQLLYQWSFTYHRASIERSHAHFRSRIRFDSRQQ